MTMRRAWLVALLALGACTPLRIPVSSELVWTRADETEVLVMPGDVVRIQASGPLKVTSVLRGPQGEADVTQTMTPKDGVILLRPSLGTAALRLPSGTVVHTSYPKDPEISWFTLEREALDWAKAPIGTPFPVLTAAPRLDASDFTDLDAALGEAKGSPAVEPIRRLVALRAIHAIEGVRSYPYARNGELELTGTTAAREIQLRDFYQIAPGKNATVTLEGPTSFALSSRMIRTGADVIAELRVKEGPRLRGVSRAIVHHLAPEGDQGIKEKGPDVRPEELNDPTLAPLRRIFVPVPPGKHTYEIETVGASAWIAGADSQAYLKLEDALAGSKNERRFAAEAMAACGGSAPGLCAIAKVLAGEDKDGIDPAASPAAKKIAEKLALGAPADRAAALEIAASTGDRAAIMELAKEAGSTIDQSLRDAWWLGTLRGTAWQTLEDPTPPTWFAFLPRDATGPAAAVCSQRTTVTEKELDTNPVTLATEPWRRVNAIRLLAITDCKAGEPPVELEVNGQKVSAQPSSARALWHIIVPAPTAKVRRLDKGATKIYALSDDQCGGGTLIHAAVPLNTQRTIAFPPNTTAPGVEVWIKQGTPSADLTLASSQGGEPLEVKAMPGNGLAAIAEGGERWIRAATIPLPAWPGVKASGSGNVAVRGVARGLKTDPLASKPPEHAAPPNVEAIAALSKRFLAAKTKEEKAAIAMERANLLASFGAERAAVEDADLAAHYGGPADAIATIRAKVLPLPPTPLEQAINGYGIEPDFDPGAQRCAVSGGERARINDLDVKLRARPKSAAYDRNLAVQAASLAAASPGDPRSETLVNLAGASSKWKLSRDVVGGERVIRPHEAEKNPLLDSDARLRARYFAGDPFGNNFVSVSPDRPAKAFVADIGAAKARLDIVCVPRKMPGPNERCPIDVKMGDIPVHPTLDEGGKASVELPHGRGRGKGAELNVVLKQVPGDYIALIRVVFDKEAPGATKVDGVGYVLDTPHIQYRFVLQAGHPLRIKATEKGMMRIDALPDTKEATEVTATFAGQSVSIPTDGEPKPLPITNVGEIVTVTAKGGPATIAVAERVESETRYPGNDADPSLAAVKPIEHETARMNVTGDGWRDAAERSPRPLTWLEDHLGAFEAMSGALGGTLRDGAPSDTAIDIYGFQTVTYRRRIEPINLYTLGTGLLRLRDGAPTYGGAFTLYEDLSVLRLRITGTLNAFAQDVDGSSETTLRPRAAIEYSGRVTPAFYILPRVGFDGYYTSLNARPPSSKHVDDDIYNAFRFERNSFAFLQGLFWWVPYFNHIAYLRARGTMDVTNGSFSHAALRPGTFVILGTFEAGGYLDAQYFERTTGARTSSGIDISGGANIVLHFPIMPGSFEIRPNATGQIRGDLGWQALAGITFIASARRGVRDYSSLELSFPEATGGGIPWRTEGSKTP